MCHCSHLKDSSVLRGMEEFDSLFRANYQRLQLFQAVRTKTRCRGSKAKLSWERQSLFEKARHHCGGGRPMLQNVLTAVKTVVDGGIDAEVLYFLQSNHSTGRVVAKRCKDQTATTVEELSSHGGRYHSALGHCVAGRAGAASDL